MSTAGDLPQAESEDGQRQRLYTSARTELLERQFSNSEAYDKAILTLSSAFLAVSLAFIKDDSLQTPLQHVFILYASWVALALAIISTVASFRISNAHIERQLNRAHLYYLEKDESAYPKGSPSYAIDWINYASGGLFVLGVVLTVAFVIFNFSETKLMSKISGNGPARIDRAHEVPALQKVVVEPLEKGQTIPQMQQVIKPQTPAAPTASAATPATQSSGGGQSSSTTQK